MYTQVEKKIEKKSQLAGSTVSQKKNGSKSTFQFVDNRPEAIAQKKLQMIANNHAAQQYQPIQTKENNTGLPDSLKSGIENLSGYSMDDVKVHYNSDKPAQLNAHAYAQGTDIHLASGQEKHLPHEAWHVVQPTMQMKGQVIVNDDAGLEKEADMMGAKAAQLKAVNAISPSTSTMMNITSRQVVQLAWGRYDGADRAAAREVLLAVLGNVDDKVTGAVLEELHHYGTEAADLQNALTLMPAHFTVPRATALIHFLTGGGTNNDAQIAIRVEPVDDVRLGQCLAMVGLLNAKPHFPGLADDKKEALLAEHTNLTTDVLRTNAITTAIAAADGPTAANDLGQTRAFGFRQDFKDRADQRGDTAAGDHILTRIQQIQDNSANDQEAAIMSKHTEAFSTLTKNQRRALGDSADKALNPMKPLLTDKYYDTGLENLKSKRVELAQPDIDTIRSQADADILNVNTTEGPAEKAKVVEEHQAYFAGVHFHPEALDVLDIAEEDKAIATAIVNYIAAQPIATALFKSDISLVNKQRLLALPGATLAGLIAAGITTDTIKEFTKSDDRFAFLTILSGAVPGVIAKINGVTAVLEGWKTYVADPTCRGHITTLLAVNTVAEIDQMLKATPDPVLARPGFLVACRPHANSVATLVAVLKKCDGFGWGQAAIRACITGQPGDSNQVVLEQAVHDKHLARHNKNTHFSSWLTDVGQLVTAGYVNISVKKAWYDMNGDNKTWEESYNINLVGGKNVGCFVVHYHPDAKEADTYDPYASKSHFKPVKTKGAQSLSYDSGPASIKALTSRNPPCFQKAKAHNKT